MSQVDVSNYPILLPHVTCLDTTLFLGNRQLEKLTDQQAAFLKHCDGTTTFGQIVKKYSFELSQILHLTKFLLWWPAPVNDFVNIFDSCDRLVITARPETPWLGMGGYLLEGAKHLKTVVLNCFLPSQRTKHAWLYRGASEYRLASRDEAHFAARLSGTACMSWNLSGDGVKQAGATLLQDPYVSDQQAPFREWFSGLLEKLEPDEIFIPAALSLEPESHFIFNFVLTLLAEGGIPSEVHLYEDRPSVHGHRYIDEFLVRFEHFYLTPEMYFRDCTEITPYKTALLDTFVTGIANVQKREWEFSSIRNANETENEHYKNAERFWRLNFTTFSH